MGKPVRIQRKRTKGWRMPPNTVYVGRGSKWGNPFKVGKPCGVFPEGMGMHGKAETLIPSLSIEQAMEFYRNALRGWLSPEMYPFGHDWEPRIRHYSPQYELRGKDLACWCPLDQPCHADILLELANPAPPLKQEG